MKKNPSLVKNFIFPFLSFCAYLFLFIVPVSAQTALGLTAIPPRLEITVKPGQTITKEIKVRNESKVDRLVTTSAKDFIVTDDKGTPVQIEGVDETSNRWAAASWIQVSPSTFRLKPGETKSLMVTIIAPDNPTAGGHYAMVLHSPDTKATLVDQTGASIQTFVGTLLYITVPGDIKENAQVKEFSAPKFLEFGPVDFKTIIANFSDIHINPVGAINIKNWFGGKTASLALESTNIFPGTTRELNNILNRKWLFGRYTANFEAGYGSSGQALTATLVFWVIPWRLIVLIIAAIIIIILLNILLHQQPPRKDNSSSKEVEELEQELEDLKKKYRDHR